MKNTNNVPIYMKTQGSKPAVRSGMVKNFNIADVYDSQIFEILAKNVEKQKQENLKIFKKLPIDTIDK